MKPSDFEYMRREVLPSEHVNVYLKMEYLLSTYFEMNLPDSEKENIQPFNLDKMKFDVWFSWN